MADDDLALMALPEYSRREIAYLAQREYVVHLDDILMRRSLIAMRGMLRLHPEAIEEIAQILAGALNWSETHTQEEIERTRTLLEKQHRFNRPTPPPRSARPPSRSHPPRP
jgi:glycerol-3-phosphate dehydrogenase